ncbi:MAG: hypothetical protein IRY91_11050 [Gemmatimonadaceae bacterium]|nr:hypothetical protein [Gemmatimonadaceae bacterium]
MQTSTPQQSQDASAAQLREQIQKAVREQVEAAREQARIARAQAQAGQGDAAPVVMVPPFAGPDAIPPEAVHLGIAFFVMLAFVIVGLPIARAFGRRMDRKAIPPAIDPALAEQIQRIENTVDAMAIEIERISEAQRYMARLQAEREPAALPSQQARG